MQSNYIKKLEDDFPSLFTTLLEPMQNYCNYNGLGAGVFGGCEGVCNSSHPPTLTSEVLLTCTGRSHKQGAVFFSLHNVHTDEAQQDCQITPSSFVLNRSTSTFISLSLPPNSIGYILVVGSVS